MSTFFLGLTKTLIFIITNIQLETFNICVLNVSLSAGTGHQICDAGNLLVNWEVIVINMSATILSLTWESAVPHNNYSINLSTKSLSHLCCSENDVKEHFWTKKCNAMLYFSILFTFWGQYSKNIAHIKVLASSLLKYLHNLYSSSWP